MKQKKKMKQMITFNSLYIEVLGPYSARTERQRAVSQTFCGRLNMTPDTS